MTWDALRAGYARRPFQLVEIDWDRCVNTFGVAPCTASGPAGSECYNTRKTCQDPGNFDGAPSTLRFYTAAADSPNDIIGFPFLSAVDSDPTRIDPGNSLGKRAMVQVELQDAPHHDRGLDPYVGTRLYNPVEQGTFWGKFLARVPYYKGRPLRVLSGFLDGSGSFVPGDYQVRHYVIESIDGPDRRGRVSIKAKDPLKLADDDRAQAPAASTGRLQAAITDVGGSATLIPAGVGDAEYPASGYVRVGGEVMGFTRVADVLTLTRGQFNTVAEAHNVDDVVQLCLHFDSVQVQDIVYELLTAYAGIDPAFIDNTAWDAEAAAYLVRLYSALITEPVGVNKLITELIQQVPFVIFWDERAQKVTLQALKPPDASAVTLSDDANFIADSVESEDDPAARVSRVIVRFGLVNPAEKLDEPSNYRRKLVLVDADSESSEKFGQPAIRTLNSRWINEFNEVAAQEFGEQVLARYSEGGRKLKFKLDARNAEVWTGAVIRPSTRYNQAADGANASDYYQVVSARERQRGAEYEYESKLYRYNLPEQGERLIVIGANTNDFNLLAAHDSIYSEAQSGDIVRCVVNSGVHIGSTSRFIAAFTVGNFAPGVIIFVELSGRLQGKGGNGGEPFGPTSPQVGGPALYTRHAITLTSAGSAQIWSGGGGGNYSLADPFIAGGGGAGNLVGLGFHGDSGKAGDGTATAGGLDSNGFTAFKGGDPGQNGSTAGDPAGGGAAGAAVDGHSYVTYAGAADIKGPQIN